MLYSGSGDGREGIVVSRLQFIFCWLNVILHTEVSIGVQIPLFFYHAHSVRNAPWGITGASLPHWVSLDPQLQGD